MMTLAAVLLLAPFTQDFTMHKVIDPKTGLVAYRYLLPKGWNAADSIAWDLSNKGKTCSASSKLTSPDGKTEISILPGEARQFQVEKGALTGTLPPETASKALDAVLSATHPGLTNATLVIRKDFDVPTPFDGQGLKTKGLVGILEVAFDENGVHKTELLSATEFEGSQGDGVEAGGGVQGLWAMLFGYTLTCSGPITEADFKTLAMVAASDRPDPRFFAIIHEVGEKARNGQVDFKAVAASVTSQGQEAADNYSQYLSSHGRSVAKMIPIYSGSSTVTTYDGPIAFFKGVHLWMKKPDQYRVSEGSDSPGIGWEAAKEGP